MKYRKGLPITGTCSPVSWNFIIIIKYICAIPSVVVKKIKILEESYRYNATWGTEPVIITATVNA